MVQYHKLVNLDKGEVVDPHKLDCGVKLREIFHTHPGPAAALVLLLASASNGDGSGDFEKGPMVGHWCGDRIAFVGDYDDKSLYETKFGKMSGRDIYGSNQWFDISDRVLEAMNQESV